MSTDKEWQLEQARVDEVTRQIRQAITKLEKEVGSVRGEVVEMRKDFWDEVTINFSEADDVGETSTNLRQQSEVLSERERSHKNTFQALGKMNKLVSNPYFGRIDFTEDGSQEKESIYLGIASFLSENDQDFLVYDWRAPISNLYYDGAPGHSSYHTPSGLIEGEITLKRQFTIRDADIKFMFDTGVTIGDQLLQAVLSRSSDATMKSIVATIQKEQNQIIRNDKSKFLIVQGAAGSGKTSAALQRVAYLLYKDREHLKADQMILFSPNPMFNSYVSTVLPELGEENMLQTTFQEYLERRIGREFQLEDPFVQLEYVLAQKEDPSYEARIQGIEFKSSQSFLTMITRYKEILAERGMMFRPLRFLGREVVSAEQIRIKFYEYDQSILIANRLELLKEWLLKELSIFGKSELDAPWVDEQIQLLSKEDYHRAYQRLKRKQQGKKETFDDFDLEREILARMVVSDRLKPLRKWVKATRFVDMKNLYRAIFKDSQVLSRISAGMNLPSAWEEISRFTTDHLQAQELAYEDTTPFLYLKDSLLGFRIFAGIRHVIIDEAQDYSPFQLAFFKRIFPRAKMTALGDFNQAIYAHSSVLQTASPLGEIFGNESAEVIRLTRSYRSTKEIVEFTKAMLPYGEEILPFNREGELPTVREYGKRDDMEEAIQHQLEQLISEGYESVAVICKSADQSKEVQERMSNKLSVPTKLVKKTTLGFDKGVQIIPAYLAKGVEFDAVLIYDGSEAMYAAESERKLFYTACTRAMHLLDIYSLGPVSPFVSDVPSERYRQTREFQSK
ncbi:RNA polymerase recycling motor HelD [Paenibacillus sp. Marseille-Q4541]|uniref:RNA polymerase recycling motor HelD n=1 Tax=Paenibacillus sp. Marseille-Q4541 TaxID=2831522 RepID=UPI001BAC6E6A|nr:RNA polymerase recycling motor HelD [Paenibacillus sp. Marseille-Q4541]